MKGNNKGFTLVELLAAIVILSILVAFSIPVLSGVFEKNRNKIYISDAQKLISLAEYKVQASSSVIEKPDDGDCILISMLYLDSTDFDNPPGEGKYLKESSYVVVKNNNGKLEYSVTTVEKLKKGGYKGVELVKGSTLITRKSLDYVVKYTEDDILNVETDVNRGYLNEKLGGNYITIDNKITAIYNYPELADNSVDSSSSIIPRIVYASVVSSENKYFNTLKATLQLRVDDKDTPRNQLNVYLNIDGNDYSETVTPIPYGNDDTFSYNIDFGKDYGKTYDGSIVKIYIVVKDPQDNVTKKTISYKIHKNEAPIIDDSSAITRRDQDIYHGIEKNMLDAKIKLILSDDVDENSQLQVCMQESPNDEEFTSCDNYHDYYSDNTFDSNGIMYYKFHRCGENRDLACARDGSVHYLTIFVKDSEGAVNSRRFVYEFSKNENPKLDSLTLESAGFACINHDECPIAEGGSKTLSVIGSGSDDVDDVGNSKLLLVVDDAHTDIPTSVGFTSGERRNFSLSGLYDGETRTLSLYLMDSEGGKSNVITRTYKVYKNKYPKINSFSIASHGTACKNSELCPISSGGSKTVDVTLDAEDDIDFDGLMVCLSLNPNINNCTKYDSYRNYSSRAKAYTMNHTYDGSTQTVYVFVKDSEEFSDTAHSTPYKLYINHPPVINYAVFNSTTDTRPTIGNLNTIFQIDAEDDVDTSAAIKIQIKENGILKVNNEPLIGYIGKENNYTMSGTHDGGKRTLEIKVFDSDGGSDTETVVYNVYQGQPPSIDKFTITSRETPCINEQYCASGNINSYKTSIKVKASDDIDKDSDIGICISESSTTCTSYISYSNFLNGTEPVGVNYAFETDKPYDGVTRTLYLYVKDTDQNITKQSQTYKMYTNKSPVVIENPTVVSNAYNASVNIPDVTYKIDVEDDLDETLQIKYCHKKNGGNEYCTDYEDFQKNKVLDNTFFNVAHPNGETFDIYSVIKDSYGAETKSEELSYTLYVDTAPSIYQSSIVSGTRIYKKGEDILYTLDNVENPSEYSEYTRLKINFSVDDQYDTYSACVSNNSTTCTDYQGSFKGNNCTADSSCTSRKMETIYYDKPGFVEDGDNLQIYLFVKDSQDQVTSIDLYDEEYELCSINNTEGAIYEYVFQEEATSTTFGHTTAITMDNCSGKCYVYNSYTGAHNNFHAVYKRRIRYPDHLNSNYICNNDNPDEEDIEVGCNFYECFKKNDNYNRMAIGTKVIPNEEVWTTTVNGRVYECTDHYNLYETEYHLGDKEITLNKSTVEICNRALVLGEYNYDPNDQEPWIRVND